MTTVYRLPEEPPIGTTVGLATGDGLRHRRLDDEESAWQLVGGRGPVRSWAGLLDVYPEGLVVVEPDLHPTPWTVNLVDVIVDANGTSVFSGEYDDHRAALERIVDAVNKAGTP